MQNGCGGPKICPQILLCALLQEVNSNSPSLECILGLQTHFQRIECDGNGSM